MNNYIGVDLGGTQVRVGVVSQDGKVLEEIIEKSNPENGRDKVLNLIFEMIDKLKFKNGVKGIGLGVPGPVVDGVMKISTNLVGFKDFNIKKVFEEKYNLPTYVDNDANVAGLAEALVGAGKKYDIVYYFTHSTGIGGALIVNGKLISGAHGFAGEIANIIVDPKGETRNFLNKGAIENLASGVSLYLRYKDELKIKDAKQLFDMAREKDEKALKAIDEMVEELSIMMSAIAHVVDPSCFVIGGGCSNASDVYFDKLEKSYKEKVHEQMRDIPIFKAELKQPGVVGAALLCVSHNN